MCIMDNKFDSFRIRMLQIAPYYPQTKEVFEPWDSFEYKTDRGRAIDDVIKTIGMGLLEPPQVKKKQITSYIMAITSIVRHEHEGIWYARHHLATRHVSSEVFSVTHEACRDQLWDKLRTEFRHHIYLDLLFGKIDPNFERPMGEPPDPRDTLQVSEKERLRL